MGLFKKKKEEPEISIFHKDMGKLTFDKTSEMWVGKYMTSIFGEAAEIDLFVMSDEDDDNKITLETEEAFRYYCQHWKDINDKIEQELRNEYKVDDAFVMSSRFKPSSLILLLDGDCGLSIRDLDFPNYDTVHGHVVVTILPKVELYGSEEEYPY